MNSRNQDTVLIVDDNEDNRIILKKRLAKMGFATELAENGKQALEIINSNHVDIILLDIMMPVMNGFQVLEVLKNHPQYRDLPVIVISGIDDIGSISKCLELGAEDYFTKPFDATLLRARVNAAIEKKHLRDQEIRYRNLIEEQNHYLEERVREKVREISAAQMAIIYAMAKMAEFRDMETGRHLDRVREYCSILINELIRSEKYLQQLTASYIENILNASPLHDIGKVGIRDEILLKPAKLTSAEFEEMKKHTIIGKEILSAVNQIYPGYGLIEVGMEIALSHHEKWDGSGYPYHLSGDEIPLSGRIVALADVYDALTSTRVYKKAIPHQDSCEIILSERGKHFDPILIDCFKNCTHEFERVSFDLRG